MPAITNFDITVRAYNALKRADIRTTEQLLHLATIDPKLDVIRMLRNVGTQAIKEIEEFITQLKSEHPKELNLINIKHQIAQLDANDKLELIKYLLN